MDSFILLGIKALVGGIFLQFDKLAANPVFLQHSLLLFSLN